jgi:hypothetical protein
MAERIISLRPHHIAKFYLSYYPEVLNRKGVIKIYSEEFQNRVESLFKDLRGRVIEQVTIVNGLDYICGICEETAERKKPGCETKDELQKDFMTLNAMARSQLVVGTTYPIKEFLERVSRIGVGYPKEELSELMRKAYINVP